MGDDFAVVRTPLGSRPRPGDPEDRAFINVVLLRTLAFFARGVLKILSFLFPGSVSRAT